MINNKKNFKLNNNELNFIIINYNNYKNGIFKY